jgi:hypothetical protein
VRKIVESAEPWLPWLAPVVVGVLDAVNVIARVATPLYVGLIVIAATVTTITQGSRAVCRALAQRFERAAEQAQVQEAALLAYKIASEHCDSHRQPATEDLPQAVGESTERLSRTLHIVRQPTSDLPAARTPAIRQTVSVGRATVPEQAQPVRPTLASTRRLQPRP